MPTVSVKVEIPEGYELACDTLRIVSRGEEFVQPDGELGRWIYGDVSGCPYLIVRPAWQWPEWLKCRYIVYTIRGKWLATNFLPRLHNSAWHADGVFVELSPAILDFTTPPCDDFRESLRENPNWKENEA